LLRYGTALPANLGLEWCNYFTTLSDSGYTGATITPDDTGNFTAVTGAATFDSAFRPNDNLRDRCMPMVSAGQTQRDFYANTMNYASIAPGSVRIADLGAVEFIPEQIFRNGFED
jgi:hypothetical protein